MHSVIKNSHRVGIQYSRDQDLILTVPVRAPNLTVFLYIPKTPTDVTWNSSSDKRLESNGLESKLDSHCDQFFSLLNVHILRPEFDGTYCTHNI